VQTSSLLKALAAHISDPLIVASSRPPDFVVVAASRSATALVSGATIASPLVAWVGPESVAALHDTLRRGEPGGETNQGRWEQIPGNDQGWIIWTLASPPTAVPIDGDVSGTASTRFPVELVTEAYRAALSVASHLELEAVLQRLVDLARQVVPAKYAALGVSDGEGRIQQFITSGLSDRERLRIGPLPEGRGLLGELIHHREPLLVRDIKDDGRSVGFPADHPPMSSLLGTPILLRDQVLGNLYLTERLHQEQFDSKDLEAVQILAAHAAAAIERARLYSQVSEQRDHIRVIIDSLPTGIMIMWESGTLELLNSSMLDMIFGREVSSDTVPTYGRDFIFRQMDGALLTVDEHPKARAFRGETVRNRQLVLERGDGSRLPVSVQAAPLRDANGQIDRALVVVQDVAGLRAAEQLKDDFLSLVSHELRTPLTSIHGASHLLVHQGEQLDEPTRQDLLTDIMEESQRLDQMLTNMLSLTAIIAGRFIASTEPVVVGPLIDRVARDVATRMERAPIQIETEAGLPAAQCDRSLLEQVLRNVIENAVKFSPPDSLIRVVAVDGSDTVTIRVIDLGPGIAHEELDRIFDRFHRVGDPAVTRGIGLGLYISRGLMDAQGGSITAQSSGAGLGTTVSISFPVARAV